MFFRRIKDLREDRDLKQKDLYEYLNIQQSTYSNYETGKINVPIEALMRLADFYQVSLDYLVERTDVKEMPKPKFRQS